MKGTDRKRERQSAEYVAVYTRVRLCSSTSLEGPWKWSKRAAIKMTRDLEYRLPTPPMPMPMPTPTPTRQALLLFPRSLPATHIRSPRSAPGAA
ncbi:hypothetical protein EAG_09042 [Camponotus floridanus]|uniref:Uncharacterized protein n=1 Tax=Camponotus floridanus TaxID=104421 RepID=E2AH54_CAMFO|nr:hypothetical protein EAG_09042 [Camponotus floridanus]